MARCSLSLRWPAAIVASLALAAIAVLGCKSGIESAALLWEGYDIPPEWDGLVGKKVAVVCKPLTSLDLSSQGVDRTLSEAICDRLKAKVKKIKIIDPQKVARLVDEKGMEDYIEIGKELKAEKVVAIEIESFSVLDGQTLFRGRSTLSIRVYDVAEKQVEWRKSPPQFEYPSYGSTPAVDFTEMDFRNKFVAILADQIGRCFYPHDRHEDYGRDALSIR